MAENIKPSFVLLDIETSPIIAYTWATFNTNVLKIIESSQIISVSWKELGSKQTIVKTIADYPNYIPGQINDELLVREIWDVMDKADIICAHYGSAFDIKKLNARFVYYGLTAPSQYSVIDTKKIASKYFKFDSNSLDNLGSYLKVGNKIKNGGFDLWVRCMNGDPKAWKLMASYNKQDVDLLEKVYYKLRPFIENHPNMLAATGIIDAHSCPACMSTRLQKRGFRINKSTRQQRYQCMDCGSWSSGTYEKLKGVT
jgi:DNA polymerase elongation subunit (family B)